MSEIRLLTALTHVASQLIYRWLPPPSSIPVSSQKTDQGEENIDIFSLSSADWFEALNQGRDRLPWMQEYVAKKDPKGSDLVKSVMSHLSHLRSAGANYVLFDDYIYPPLLRMINDPPLGLSAFGDLSLFQKAALSIVGSRKASHHSYRESVQLGLSVANAGFVVVSGGAIGCDIAAHKGVLMSTEFPAPAIVVFAGGLSQLYPRRNFRTFNDLKGRGALLISERLWNYSCRAFDFPVRNRIISGLSRATIVMQSAKASGAMTTAQIALNQGREICVLAHPAHDQRATGNHFLAEQGAVSFENAQDFIGNFALF